MPTTTGEGRKPYLPHSRALKQPSQSPAAEEMGRERLDSPRAWPMLSTSQPRPLRQKGRAHCVLGPALWHAGQPCMPPLFPFTEKKTEAREVEQFTRSHTANAVAEAELELRPPRSRGHSFFLPPGCWAWLWTQLTALLHPTTPSNQAEPLSPTDDLPLKSKDGASTNSWLQQRRSPTSDLIPPAVLIRLPKWSVLCHRKGKYCCQNWLLAPKVGKGEKIPLENTLSERT